MNQAVWKALILLPTVLCLEFSSVWVYLSVQFSHSVMSNSFWPHGLQHARLLCPSPAPRTCSNSCPSSQRGHPTSQTLSSPSPPAFSFFPASGSFLMSQFFTSGGQSIGASASVLPMTTQDWFPLALTGLISCSPRDSLKSLLQHHSSKASFLWRVFALELEFWDESLFSFSILKVFCFVFFCWEVRLKITVH